MIKFDRYPHINDLFSHYIHQIGDAEISHIFNAGVLTEEDAKKLSKFVWKMVEQMNADEENDVSVLGSTDNSEMFPDLNYEISVYMKKVGFYSVWEKISENEI